MSLSEVLIQKAETWGAHNYHPLPIVLTRGKDCRVWDTEGKEYLDFLSCYSALNFGHQHPDLVSALKEQVDKLAVCSRAFWSDTLAYFCEELASFCGMEMVLPMNSGAEACETAIKMARKWGYQKKGISADKANIIVMANSFHGRTVTLVSFSSEPIYRNDFGPFTPGFKVVPYNDVAAVENAIDANTVGILLEPIQAEAGILLPATGYMTRLHQLCKKNKILLMLDEIQTGLGRTGKDFCYQYEAIVPDVLILGKSLGGGLLPVSAVVSSKDVMGVFKPGEHGSTFGGNPLACAVARQSLKVLKSQRLSERSYEIGQKAMAELTSKPMIQVEEIRGRGALIGIELKKSTGGARRPCEELAKRGVLCKETHDYVIRIAPPLTISDSDLLKGISEIKKVISAI